MNKLPLLAALLLTTPADAVVVGGVRAPAGPAAASASAAWSAPILGAFSAAGLERVGSLGSASLSALASPVGGWTPTAAAFPATLAPLIRALPADVTPEAFAALPVAARLSVLARAADRAEAAAASAVRAAADAADAAEAGVGMRAEALRLAAATEGLDPYLDESARAQAAGARTAAYRFGQAREALIKAFMEGDLAGRISAARREGTPLIRLDAAGWRALDEHPDAAYASVGRWAAARLARLEASPSGPWIAAEASVVARTLRAPRPSAALQAEDPAAAAALLARADALDSYRLGRPAAPSRAALDRARIAPSARYVLGAADLRRISADYLRALTAGGDRTAVSWVAASLINGWEGLVPWHRLKAHEEELRYAARRRQISGGVGAAVAAPFAAAAAVFGAPAWAVVAGGAFALGGLLVLAVALLHASEPFTARTQRELDAVRGRAAVLE